MPKPRYFNLSGFEPSPPPFTFYDVASRVFPLRASPRRLQTFCDRYLNLAPEISYCRPLAPVVLLCILNYGRMGGGSVGWIAQNEVLFTLLLEWRHLGPDGENVTELATVTPFLFVDDPLSQVTGREVYGWPKIKGWYEPDIESWGADVVTRPRPIRLSTLVFPRAYEGQRPQRRPLLEVDIEQLSGLTDTPPDFRFLSDSVWSARRGVAEMFRMGRDWLELLMMQGGPPDLLSLLPMLPRIPFPGLPGFAGAGSAEGIQPDMSQRVDLAYRTLTLKQFPNPASRRDACYQAIVSTAMEITRYKGFGFLGEQTLLRGDTSGGFVVRLHRCPEFPIVNALGIDVERWEETETTSGSALRGVTRGPADSHLLSPFEGELAGDDATRHAVAVIRPMTPYWLDADLVYGTGQTVCWRTSRSDWSTGEEPGPATSRPLRYNTANGDVFIPAKGPFLFRDATLRVLALEIDRGDGSGTFPAQALIDAYLNRVLTEYRLEVVGDYVFLVTGSYESTESKSNDVGWWADRELGFWILLRRAGEKGNRGKFHYHLTSPFLFGSSHFAALTLRETFGLPSLRANLESPPDSWMGHRGPNIDRTLLRLSTSIFPAVTSDLQARVRTLLEIIEVPSRDDLGIEAEDVPPESWRALYEGLDFAAAEYEGYWLKPIFLRRFRDAAEPDRACFESLMEGSIGLTHVRGHLLDPDRLEVRIHNHPSHPLVEKLGLKPYRQERRPSTRPGRAWEGRPVDVLRPRFAFWMLADMETGLSDEETHLYPPPASTP